MKYIALFSLILILSNSCFTQVKCFTNYSAKNGLPSSQVYDIIEDDYGYLWFSTDKGLSRYNGYEFENFDKRDGLLDNVVFDFHKKTNGEIWCTTNSGVLFGFKGKSPTFLEYAYNDTILKYAKGSITRCLHMSSSGDVFLAHLGSLGFLHISKEGRLIKQHLDRGSLGDRQLVLKLNRDDSSEPFFFIDNEGLEKYEGLTLNGLTDRSFRTNLEGVSFDNFDTDVYINSRQGDIYIVDSKDTFEINSGKSIIASGKLNSKEFWVGYAFGGLDVFDLNGNKKNHFLGNQSVTQLFQDSQNNSWVSTLTSGVYRYNLQTIESLPEIDHHHISALCTKGNGSLLIGCYNGNIIERSRDGQVKNLFSSKVKSPANVFYNSTQGKTYYGVNGILCDDQKKYPYSTTNLIFNEQELLISGYRGVVIFKSHRDKNPKTKYSEVRPKDLILFNEKLHIGTISGLAYAEDYHSDEELQYLFKDVRIDDLARWKDYLLLGTNGDGLIIVDTNYQKKIEITSREGLNSNFVNHVYPENDSTIWLGTNAGVSRVVFNDNGYVISKMSVDDGLTSNEIWDVLILRDTIWVGTQNGINLISKDHFESLHEDRINLNLQWKKIFVEGIGVVTDGNKFNYDQNTIDFSFLGIDFQGNDKLVYRYRMKGVMDHWKHSKSRKVSFSALPPGSYELLVQVKRRNEAWGKSQIKYRFVITPPFWKTWWFVIISIAFCIGLIYLAFRFKVLSYNKVILREASLYVLRKMRKESPSILIKVKGKEMKLPTDQIHFIKSDGNYLEIHTGDKMHLVRSSMNQLTEQIPDRMAFIQIHRSYIVRVDKVKAKGKKGVLVLNDEVPVGKKYLDQMDLIQL